MCGLSFRRASQCVIELLIGNEKVPDERTDMSKAIAYTLSSSMGWGGGIHMRVLIMLKSFSSDQ